MENNAGINMEEVAIMMPTVVNNDELSDEAESINLDLHVSDTEESTESLKKCNAESEEDILNKYVDDITTEDGSNLKDNLPNGMSDEQSEKNECNGISSPTNSEADDSDSTVVGEKDDDNLDETLLNDEKGTEEVKSDVNTISDNPSNENCEANTERSEQLQQHELIENGSNHEDNTEDCSKTNSNKTENVVNEQSLTQMDEDIISDNNEKITDDDEEIAKTETTETKTYNDDNDDLLCVMDEKSIEEANEAKDESEKDDENKENEENDQTNNEESNEESNEEGSEETNEDTKEDDEAENTVSHAEMDIDASECAMDIEESDIGGVVYTDTKIESTSEHLNNSGNKVETDKDANKENEHGGDVRLTDVTLKQHTSDVTRSDSEKEELKKNVAIQDSVTEEEEKDIVRKSSKRQLSDSSTESESTKKIKLQAENIEKPTEKEKRSIKLLDSFKKFMLDKKLKNLTRFELEELCIQKMCECIVNKSEIGELRQKVMIQEQTIDTWRKEAVVVAKQTRDLKIVHERLMADLKTMKEQTGKPLVPVKITRSVGLQAIIENPTKVRQSPVVNGNSLLQQRAIATNLPSPKVATPTQSRQQQHKPKVTQRTNLNNNSSRPLQPITQKNNMNNTTARQPIPSPQQSKKNSDLKGVIDLTDEDEKNQNAKQSTNTASPTIRILNKQNMGTAAKSTPQTTNSQTTNKIMFVSPNVLQRNSTVMVKMNANGLVSPQNGLAALPNGQVSVVTSPVVRTVSQVKVPVSTVTTVRTATPTKQLYKHPAPLPAAPNYQNSIVGKKPVPPKPHLNLTRSSCGTGIVLQWKMPYKLDSFEPIVSYQLYAYQETKSPPKTDNWGKIGDVKALELPMAVTLTQFAVGNRYFFAVRAVDLQKRLGPFSDPENILL